MTVSAGILVLCLRVAGVKWGGVLLGVPLEDFPDLALWGSRDDGVGCCETSIHNQ